MRPTSLCQSICETWIHPCSQPWYENKLLAPSLRVSTVLHAIISRRNWNLELYFNGGNELQSVIGIGYCVKLMQFHACNSKIKSTNPIAKIPFQYASPEKQYDN